MGDIGAQRAHFEVLPVEHPVHDLEPGPESPQPVEPEPCVTPTVE